MSESPETSSLFNKANRFFFWLWLYRTLVPCAMALASAYTFLALSATHPLFLSLLTNLLGLGPLAPVIAIGALGFMFGMGITGTLDFFFDREKKGGKTFRMLQTLMGLGAFLGFILLLGASLFALNGYAGFVAAILLTWLVVLSLASTLGSLMSYAKTEPRPDKPFSHSASDQPTSSHELGHQAKSDLASVRKLLDPDHLRQGYARYFSDGKPFYYSLNEKKSTWTLPEGKSWDTLPKFELERNQEFVIAKHGDWQRLVKRNDQNQYHLFFRQINTRATQNNEPENWQYPKPPEELPPSLPSNTTIAPS